MLITKNDLKINPEFVQEIIYELLVRLVMKNLNKTLDMTKNTNIETRRKQETIIEDFLNDSSSIEFEEMKHYETVSK